MNALKSGTVTWIYAASIFLPSAARSARARNSLQFNDSQERLSTASVELYKGKSDVTIRAVRGPFVEAEHTVLGCRCVLVAVRQARALKGERASSYIPNNISEYPFRMLYLRPADVET